MGARFAGLRIPSFVEALHVADEQSIGLVLDLKDKGMAVPLLAILKKENSLAKVRFGGEWDDIRQTYPSANEDQTASLEPPVTREAVAKLHEQGKVVIANFSANVHEMDLTAMRSAVAAGVDWINVDYPRFGAEAIGQPVESKLPG